jgi:anti-anti-sigma factor
METVSRLEQMADATLRVERLSGHAGLRVSGEVDKSTSSEWAQVLAGLQAGGAPGRLDLSGLSFIDVRGVVSLVDAAQRLPSGQLRLYRPPWSLRRALDLAWTDEMNYIVIEDEEAE